MGGRRSRRARPRAPSPPFGRHCGVGSDACLCPSRRRRRSLPAIFSRSLCRRLAAIAEIEDRDRLAGQLGNRIDELALLTESEGEGPPLLPGPAGTADPVNIVFGVGRHVVIDHAGQHRDIDAAGRDVGGHEEIDVTFLEGIERLGALALIEIAVDIAGLVTGALQLAAQHGDVALAVAKDDRLVDILPLRSAS